MKVYLRFQMCSTAIVLRRREKATPSFSQWWKLVTWGGSGWGRPYWALPSWMAFMRNAMFRPSVRMVWRPSLSWRTSSGVLPYTLFLFWLLALGLRELVMYFFSTSMLAVVPPRRQDTTAAPTFMVRFRIPVL